MRLKLDYCKKGEVAKVIEVMRQSGEWDDWKQKYLEHNWIEVARTFRGIVESQGKLGIILVLKDGPKVVGTLPLARIGKESLLFGCSGILKKYANEGDVLLDKELFQKIPRFYKTLLSYTRPSSLQWLPAPFRVEKLKDMEDLLQNWDTLPEFFRKSINIYGPFDYCEFLPDEQRRSKEKKIKTSKIGNFQPLLNSKSEIFSSTKSLKLTMDLYKKFGLYLSRFIISDPKVKAVCFAGSPGLSGSGYTDCCFIFCRDRDVSIDKTLTKAATFYRTQGKRRFLVLLPPGFLRNTRYLRFIKPLCQIFYDIPSNRKWRTGYF